MALNFEHTTDITRVPAADWNQLAEGCYPFLRHEFLALLEKSGSVCKDSGWQPHHLLIKDAGILVGAMPLYLKYHSYGEYVFDWAWADAYRRYGFSYYPKLLCAIPFTPVTGQRLLLAPNIDQAPVLPQLQAHLSAQCDELGLSSCHILFPTLQEANHLTPPWLQRHSVQFQWHNQGYLDFPHYLSTFSSRKRKNVKKERAKITDAGITVERFYGKTLSQSDINFFHLCYQQTYLKRSGHGGYLTEAFFDGLLSAMPNNILLVKASQHNAPVAAALYFYDKNGLYGRYWGCLQELDALHFECCYYQGIEFCIEKNIPLFNPGTQGEHKIQRGFEPITCYSSHWIARPDFRVAIENYTIQERKQIKAYKDDAKSLLPFKQNQV